MSREYACLDCGKIKMINTAKNNYETYTKKYPRCHPCGAKKAENKIKVGWFKKGSAPFNKGRLGDYLPHWKGDNVSKDALHDWIENWKGKPSKCEFCGTTEGKFQWSNISGEYKRDLNDFQRLCVKCHCKYDFEMFGARKEFYKR